MRLVSIHVISSVQGFNCRSKFHQFGNGLCGVALVKDARHNFIISRRATKDFSGDCRRNSFELIMLHDVVSFVTKAAVVNIGIVAVVVVVASSSPTTSTSIVLVFPLSKLCSPIDSCTIPDWSLP